MTFDDLDWECGEIVVRGKGQRLARLPLPADVGTALADYLCRDRPSCPTSGYLSVSAPLTVCSVHTDPRIVRPHLRALD